MKREIIKVSDTKKMRVRENNDRQCLQAVLTPKKNQLLFSFILCAIIKLPKF